MKKAGILSFVILMLGMLTFSPSVTFAATDGFYTSSPATTTWDGTDANRQMAKTAAYTYTYGDDASVTYTMPWTFFFYGKSYSQITADTNGNIWFGTTGSAHSYSLANNGRGPVIAAWNNDLSSYYYGGVFIRHKTNPERVVIEWQTETYTTEGLHKPSNFEVVLFPSGNISLDYKNFTSTATNKDFGSGISNNDGKYSVNLTNEKGNVFLLAGKSFLFAVDTTKPTISAFTTPATSTTLSVPISSFTATDNIAVTGYLITESSTAPLSTATGWTAISPTSYIAAAAGSHILYPWTKDAAGNVSVAFATPRTVVIDTTAPTTTAAPLGGTYAAAQSVTLTCSDGTGAGCDKIYYTTDGTTPTTASSVYAAPLAISTTTVLKYIAKDKAGNAEVVRTQTYTIDTTKPTISAFTTPATSATLSVPVSSFTATDNIAVTGYLITESSSAPLSTATGWTATAPTSYTATTAGSHILYPWTKDAVGNVSAAFATPRTVVITLPDTTKPTISAFTTPATSATLSVPISSFTATDNIAVTGYLITESSTAPLSTATGWTVTAPTSYTATTAGSHILYPWAKDAVGNVSALFTTPRTVVVDTTKPTISAFTTPATSTTLSVPISSLTATDNIAVTGYLITESSTPPLSTATSWTATAPTSYAATTAGSHILYPWTKDAAGNVSAAFATPRTVVITLPTYTIKSTVGNGGTVSPTAASFNAGASQTFTITPSTGYAIQNVYVDGESKGAINSYTFSNVSANHTINIYFKIDPAVCLIQPIRIARTATTVYYASLQAAYNAALDGDTIQVQTQLLLENLNVNRNVSVTIDGGYSCSYGSNPDISNLLGSVTLSSGSLTMKNMHIIK